MRRSAAADLSRCSAADDDWPAIAGGGDCGSWSGGQCNVSMTNYVQKRVLQSLLLFVLRTRRSHLTHKIGVHGGRQQKIRDSRVFRVIGMFFPKWYLYADAPRYYPLSRSSSTAQCEYPCFFASCVMMHPTCSTLHRRSNWAARHS